MKTKSIMKNKNWQIPWILVLAIFFFGSCSDDNDLPVFDPNKPLSVTSFSPETGGANTRLLLTGENFGTNAANIVVTIGGARATVVGANGNYLYVVVPKKASEGTIEIIIYDENGMEQARTTAAQKFDYVTKRLVSTLVGHVDEKGEYEIIDGPFGNCGGIAKIGWLSFDPKNPNHLYLVGDQTAARLVDLKNKYMSTLYVDGGLGGVMYRMRSISWSLTADSMIVSTWRSSTYQSNGILTRDNAFKTAPYLITGTRRCCGSAVHPVNGELYLGESESGSFYRYDMATKETTATLFQVQSTQTDFKILIHPSGNYAYLCLDEKGTIMRTDYNWEDKVFTTPYVFCGDPNNKGWADGVGKRARLDSPFQGVFVKNPDYAGKADEYDFYFCDRGNHCVRILTPEGIVSTFAGRGSVSANNAVNGYVDGGLRDEARFHNPEGIEYDATNDIFYIGDTGNHRIRKIAWED
ncbi:IPT/TIG domain-containing protein [Bacteroidales bacterium OttesenSCG-928-A17]|nr:IPT/TIG domain-containing protein [Bacteroidales bacterium OttesenSCG-928-A17]